MPLAMNGMDGYGLKWIEVDGCGLKWIERWLLGREHTDEIDDAKYVVF